MARKAEDVLLMAPSAPANAPDYYRPANFREGDTSQMLSVAEEKLQFLQDEERRNRTRAKTLEEEISVKQQKIKSLTGQQDERRAHLRALDEEIIKKQQMVTKLALEAEERSRGLGPIEEQYSTKKQALDRLAAQQDEMRMLLKQLEAEITLKQRAIANLGDQSAEAAEKQRVIANLLLQQQKLQEELDYQRRQVHEKVARSATAETHTEMMAINIDRQQIQLKMLEQEYRSKKQSLETMQGLLESTETQYNEIHGKASTLERELSKRRTELQLVEEELIIKKQMLQDVMLQHARLQAEADQEKRRLRNYKTMEDIQQENMDLKEQVTYLKQELTRAQLSVEDKAYKAQSLEALVQMQRQRQENAPLLSCSPMTVASTGDQRQQLVNLLRRQEDRITKQQHDLADKEQKVRKAEAHAQQEQELREMVENELSVALAELQMEKGKVAMLQRTCDLQDVRVAALEGELEKIRQGELLMLLDGAQQAEIPPVEVSEPIIPDVSASIRRQQELLAQISQQGSEGSQHNPTAAFDLQADE